MRDPLGLLREDLRQAPSAQKVIYLEGKTDPDIFFALLGLAQPPRDGVHKGILVKGLSANKGSGAEFVRLCIQCADRTPGYAGKFVGIVDGDGIAQPLCGDAFDPGLHGPLLAWPVYCIENLLPQTGWPVLPTWGPAPDWQRDLLVYAPYVATNRLARDAQAVLRRLEIDRFINPHEPLKTTDGIVAVMEQNQHLLPELGDIAGRFRSYVEEFRHALGHGLHKAHANLNGKWLLSHMAPRRTGLPPERCREQWIAHVASVGGHPQVRALWRRATGQDP